MTLLLSKDPAAMGDHGRNTVIALATPLLRRAASTTSGTGPCPLGSFRVIARSSRRSINAISRQLCKPGWLRPWSKLSRVPPTHQLTNHRREAIQDCRPRASLCRYLDGWSHCWVHACGKPGRLSGALIASDGFHNIPTKRRYPITAEP